MANKEILILGAGPAGLAAAIKSEELGNRVHILTPATSPGYRSVYTTTRGESGGVIEKLLPGALSPLNNFLLVTDDCSVRVRGRGFGMVDYPAVIRQLRKRLGEAEVEEFAGERLPLVISDWPDCVQIKIGGEVRQYDALIDCTGDAAITRPPRENCIVEYVYGGVFQGKLAQEEMVIPLVREIGATCWVNPSVKGSEYVDVVVSAWGWKKDTPRFMAEGPQRLALLKRFLIKHGVTNFIGDNPEFIFSGTIRSQLPPALGYQRIYSAGEAAGMARPKTGDGFRWAIYGGQMTAQAVELGIMPDRARAQFHTGDRAKYKDLFLQGATLYKLPMQESGRFGTSVKPLGETIKKYPDLEEAGINFFLNGGVDARLFLALLGNHHFRGAFVGAALAQLRFFIQGEEGIYQDYPFPKLAQN